MPPPERPKLYHILNVDRLSSVVTDGRLWCDKVMASRPDTGTTIGMGKIKLRRLNELRLRSHPTLHVGECVPFYFCPRSVMLYLLHQGNHQELTYLGGQGPIVHLEADLHAAVDWARRAGLRWAFTLSNAGAYYFEDRCELDQLHEVNWEAVSARKWSGNGVSEAIKHGKQAEFLVEREFPWHLVERIGVLSQVIAQQVASALADAHHRPSVEIRQDWYY